MKASVKFATIVAFILALVLPLSQVYADPLTETDPEVMFVGNPGQLPGTSTTFLYNDSTHSTVNPNSVNPISTATIEIQENGNGLPALHSPFYLILGIPNVSNFTAPVINSKLSPTGTGSFYVSENGFSSDDVYSFLDTATGTNDFKYGSPSESFGNWAGAEKAVNGIIADSFEIFVYDLSNTGISGGKTVDATFDFLPCGTFAVAYGTDVAPPASHAGDVFATPFTQAGLTTHDVPEPKTLLLLGAGMLVSALFCRRRKKV